MAQIPNTTDTLQECMDLGMYHEPLKLFFSHQPQALRYYADVPRSTLNTILHYAVAPNCADCLSPSFVNHILNLNKKHNLGLLQAKNNFDYEPLHSMLSSSMNYDAALFERVVQEGNNVNTIVPSAWRRDWSGNSILVLFASPCYSNREVKLREEKLKILLKYGAQVNLQNARGETALYLLCGDLKRPQFNYNINPNLKSVKVLLEHGADPTIRANNGETALDRALHDYENSYCPEYVEIIQTFLTRGCEIPFAYLKWCYPHSGGYGENDGYSTWSEIFRPFSHRANWRLLSPSGDKSTYLHQMIKQSNRFNETFFRQYCTFMKDNHLEDFRWQLLQKNDSDGKQLTPLSYAVEHWRTNQNSISYMYLDNIRTLQAFIRAVFPTQAERDAAGYFEGDPELVPGQTNVEPPPEPILPTPPEPESEIEPAPPIVPQPAKKTFFGTLIEKISYVFALQMKVLKYLLSFFGFFKS